MAHNHNILQESISQGFRLFSANYAQDSQPHPNLNLNSNGFTILHPLGANTNANVNTNNNTNTNTNQNSIGFHHWMFLKHQEYGFEPSSYQPFQIMEMEQERSERVEKAANGNKNENKNGRKKNDKKKEKHVEQKYQHDEFDQDNDMSMNSGDRYGLGEKQKLTNLAIKVKKILESAKITSATEITRMLLFDGLQEKKQKLTQSEQKELKRMKRRVYDTINIFASLKLVEKQKGGMILSKIKGSESPIETVTRRRISKTSRARKLEATLEYKKGVLESKRKQYAALVELVKENKLKSNVKRQEQIQSPKVHFPFIAFITEKNGTIQYNQHSDEKVLIKTSNGTNIIGDLDFVGLSINTKKQNQISIILQQSNESQL